MIEDEMTDLFGADDDFETTNNTISQILVTKEPLAEIKKIQNIGGERGLFAKVDLPAGALILSEIPVIVWPECDLTETENLIGVLRVVCQNPSAIDTTKNLHPMKLENADEDEIKQAREAIEENVLTEIAQSSFLDVDEVIRILLTLQHNGFSSGLYEYLSIANHSCDPNCIKFMPQSASQNNNSNSHSSNQTIAIRNSSASEIWSTRPIKQGEEITICYCVPLEMTNAAMQSFLLQHHRFTCRCNKCAALATATAAVVSVPDRLAETAADSSANLTDADTNSADKTDVVFSLCESVSLLNHDYYLSPTRTASTTSNANDGDDSKGIEQTTAAATAVVAAMEITDYLSQEGLRLLSSNPPGTVSSGGDGHGNDDESMFNSPTMEGDEAANLGDDNVDNSADGNTTAATANADPVSTYVENELQLMESELRWYRAEDPANNLKTYSAMIVASEYLMCYYCEHYCELIRQSAGASVSIDVVTADVSACAAVVDGTDSEQQQQQLISINSCVSQLAARILKVSIQASLICLEMIDIIRANATSETSRSFNVTQRLKCKRYIDNIKIDKLLFNFIVEVYLKNSLLLLAFQKLYLGSEHPDIGTTCHDIQQGLELICGSEFSEADVSAHWALLNRHGEATYAAVLRDTVTFPTRKQGVTTKHYLHTTVMKAFKKEGDRIKALYSIVRRFPESLTGSRQPGYVYWGNKQALDKANNGLSGKGI